MKLVTIGLSGGVDSAVAAYLLVSQGYQVNAVFMKNWEEDDRETYCPDAIDIQDAEQVCQKLNIPFTVVNFSRTYWDKVFAWFLSEYQAGRTPNPDVLCNSEIKFKAFLDYAETQGTDYIATGHYVRRTDSSPYLLLKGCDSAKDQSYFLHQLNPYQLQKSLFPIGKYSKQEVRQIAKTVGFKNYSKKGSTGICFIGERPFQAFLQQYLHTAPGDIETLEGKRLGKHSGLFYYTIGQRQGLKIGGQAGFPELPWYVVAKDFKRNVLVVVQGGEHPALFSKTLFTKQIHWISGTQPQYPFHCAAKIRYRQIEQPCIVYPELPGYRVDFETPQRAITPGQYVVFYEGEQCLGGGAVESARIFQSIEAHCF